MLKIDIFKPRMEVLDLQGQNRTTKCELNGKDGKEGMFRFSDLKNFGTWKVED